MNQPQQQQNSSGNIAATNPSDVLFGGSQQSGVQTQAGIGQAMMSQQQMVINQQFKQRINYNSGDPANPAQSPGYTNYQPFNKFQSGPMMGGGLQSQNHPMGQAAAAMSGIQFNSPGLHGLQPGIPNGGLQRQGDKMFIPGLVQPQPLINGQLNATGMSMSAKNSFSGDKELQNMNGIMNLGAQQVIMQNQQSSFPNLGSLQGQQSESMAMKSGTNQLNYGSLPSHDTNLGENSMLKQQSLLNNQSALPASSGSQETKVFDVLRVYDNADNIQKQSIFTGGLDTGIEIGKFVIDTSNNITNTSQQQIQERYADRFQGPYARTQLNSRKLVNWPEDSQSETRSNYLMEQYFKLINTSMHGQPGSKVESESFSHDFRLPKSYDIPKLRENRDQVQQNLITPEKMKQFPDKVLFYIFYNMPHDKSQLNASKELQERNWIYLDDSMQWIKPNPQTSSSSKKETNGKKGKQIARNTKKQDTQRTVIVFNPLLWKEEIVSLLED